MKLKFSDYKVIGLLFALFVIGIFVASPSRAVVRTTSCGTVGTLQNGSFETTNTSATGFGWRTTATDGAFEIWSPSNRAINGNFNISSPDNDYAKDGTAIAELQANNAGGANQGLYQDISTTPNSRIFISFWHHFRGGVNNNDQRVEGRVGAVPSGVPAGGTWTSTEQSNSTSFGTSIGSNTASPNEDWEEVRATYDVPSGQTNTRFLFLSLASPANGYGNLLDNIQFTPFLACPVTRTVTFGSTDQFNVVTTSDVTYGINQSLSSVANATNPSGTAGSGSASGNVVSFTPATAGNGQTLDYTASMTFSGTTYTDEARITYNVEATVPGAPTGLSGTASGTQVALSWTAPTNNGGVAISDYLVEFREGTGAWQTFNDGTSSATSATVTGLTGDVNYGFRVSAKNDGSGYSGSGTTGTGSASSILTVNAWVCSDLDEFDNIQGLVLWLRADCVNGTTTLPSDGSNVETWEDLSGNNNDATRMTGKTAPTFQNDAGNLINGQPVLNFTRTSDTAGSIFQVNNVDIRAMTMPDVTIFVVYKPRRVSGDAAEIHGVWGVDTGGWDRFFLSKFQNWGNDGLISLGPSGSSTPTTCTTSRVCGAGTDGTTRLVTAIYDGTVTGTTNSGPTNASKIYFGSTLITSFTDTTTGGSDAQPRLYIGWDGDGSSFRGDIAEFIVFDRALESDLPSINEYLNARYNLALDASVNLPDVILVDPRRSSVELPNIDISTSTNAMICFSQVANSSGGTLSGSATISVSRSSTTSGVTENVGTNLWRYSGTRANVNSQLGSIQISGTGSNPPVTTSSKWMRIRVSHDTSTSDCTNNPVSKVVEIRPLQIQDNTEFDVQLE